jgi:hypothetical protein
LQTWDHSVLSQKNADAPKLWKKLTNSYEVGQESWD